AGRRQVEPREVRQSGEVAGDRVRAFACDTEVVTPSAHELGRQLPVLVLVGLSRATGECLPEAWPRVEQDPSSERVHRRRLDVGRQALTQLGGGGAVE